MSGKAPVLPIRPYVQASVGAGGTKYTGPTAAGISNLQYHSKFMYEILGGVDYTLVPHVDLRVIEIGVGRQTGASGAVGNPAVITVEVSTGLVIRL